MKPKTKDLIITMLKLIAYVATAIAGGFAGGNL